MPVSPYISQNNYSSRPYSRANGNSSYTPTTTTTSSYGTSKYFGGDSAITSTATGYKTGGYGKSKLPQPEDKPPSYLAGRYKSSDNIPESQTLLELKLKKSNSNSTLLAGHTANMLKNFNKTDDKNLSSPYVPPKLKYSPVSVEERKFCGKSGGVSIFASHYLNKVNKGRDFRPREIDTRDINTTVKPKITPGFRSNYDENSGAITRGSRHVVRLTIKRQEAEDPFTVKDKTIKTIAQRLIEKYTEKEKKPDPYEYVPRKRLYEDNHQNHVKDEKPVAVATPTPSSIVTSSIASDTLANSASKDPTISTTSPKKSPVDLRATMSPQSSFEDEGDVAFRLLRATTMAAKQKDLENSEEVRDAIIAAVLHPDIDIESDEEMKELVQDSKDRRDSWEKKPDKKYSEITDDHSDEGNNIVGQLKRFVKMQVSAKGRSKKKSSEKKRRSGSKKSKKESKKSENQCQVDNSILNDKEEEIKPKSDLSENKSSVKEEDSILSADLIFGANKPVNHKKSKDRILKSTDAGNKESIQNYEVSHSRKGENKIESSLLSADLIFNNLTSDEEIDSRPKEVDAIKEKVTEEVAETANNNKSHKLESVKTKGKSEKTASKIPKIKKRVKKAAVEEATEVVPEIKVFPVGSQSDTPLEGPAADVEEKVSEFKEAREADTFSGINKKISSKTFTTGNGIETSDHQFESTSSVGPKNSIPGKEIKSMRSEKSSADDKKEKLSGEKSISDVSVELKTSKKSRVGEVAQGNKDENAVKPELSQEGEISFAESNPPSEIPKEEKKEEKRYKKSDRRKKEEKVEEKKEIEEKVEVKKELEEKVEVKKEIEEKVEEKKEIDEHKKNEIGKKSSRITKIDSVKDTQLNDNKDVKQKMRSKKSSEMVKIKKEENKKEEQIKEKEEVNEPETIIAEVANISKVEKGEIKESLGKDNEVQEEKNIENEADDNKEVKQDEVSTDALEGKKAIKRPRQVAPPPPQENVLLGNTDLMNLRKILKRPAKKIGVLPAPEEKIQSQPTTPDDPTKKIWKRPITQLVPLKEGDQFLQARNVLKKPGKPKAPADDKVETPIVKLPELKMKMKIKKFGAVAQKDGGDKVDKKQRSRSPSSSDEEGEGETKKGERPKRPMKPRSSSGKKTSGPPESPSGTAKLEGSGKDPKLSACQSADSGYGSSPSTPQPTQTTPDVKDEEICTVCGTNCHKKCEKQMANLCGVNQKLLAEALSSVKKAGSADGTSRTMASPTKSSSVSGSESETTEEESETDTDTDYFGLPEIRPPLQSRPKFKKYTIDDFLFVKVLGKGSYGKVMLAQQKDSENYFAVKCLKKDVVLEDNDVECTLIERKVLSLGTKHPYLCHLFCTFQTPSHLFFVMEYLTGGDLMFHIQHCGRFDEYRACFYAAEITSGLKFLHSKGIIYRDLKLDNILLDYQGHIRIADFGMCKLQVYLDRFADTFCGTPDYMAPEVIKGQHYNQCVDWWSFGVLLYEMLTGKSPFKGCDEDHLFWLICNDEPFFPKFLSREATEILKGLLDKDSNNRLGIPFSPYGEIQEHAFFKYVDWNKIERKEVETPYKPRLRHILDVQYFDRLFTKRQAAITPLDESILATMDQTAFTDFSYTNPNITD